MTRQDTPKGKSAGRIAVLTLIAAGVALLAASAGAVVVKAADPTHLTGTFTFPDTLCGFTGTSQVQFIDNFGTTVAGTTYDSGQLTQTFIADNGRGVKMWFNAGHLVNLPPVVNAEGTTSLVFITDGLDLKTQAVHGPLLQQNTGRVQVTTVVAPNGTVVSVSAVVLAGPNPNPTGIPDCSVVGPFLAGA